MTPKRKVKRSLSLTKLIRSVSGSKLQGSKKRSSFTGYMTGDQSNSTFDNPVFLLDRLGGMAVLDSIVKEFCNRVTRDNRLQVFFEGVDPRLLIVHQKRFFAMAFTTVNEESAVATIRRAHHSLFVSGLNEIHFDVVVGHLKQTLADRGFSPAIVDEAIGTIAPLRGVFQSLAQDCSSIHVTPSIFNGTE